MADETENLNINIGSDPSGVERGTQRASNAIKGTTKEAKELDSAFRRIKSAVDPTFAATERYNKSLADNKRLLAAGKIDRDEYLANARALKSALDAQVASINRNSAAGRAAAAEARRQAAQQKQDAQAAAEAERQAARAVAQEKIAAARAAAAAVEAAQRREQQAIKLSAQTARQAALEARRLAQTAASPSVRGVAPGSIATDRSAGQLAYARQRAEEAAARASQRAWDLAARAAEASSQRAAASLQAQAQRARQQAEEYSTRAVQLARTQASEEGRLAQQAANEIRAAKEAERAATRQAAAEAKAAAAGKRNAERMAAAAAREAAEATRQQARAEREAQTAAQQLRASIDPVFAAQQRYNQVMQQATQLLMQNKLQTGEWTRIQQQAKAQMDVNVRSMGRMNSVYVQMGYQAQDVTASLASGINPLVILAQQGGQTAAALAQMGGTVGRVAAFMAGPWGAAIIGFTMLIGLMMGKSKDAEKATLDLSNAEKVRKASLKDLTEALEDFNREQERANTNNREALELDRQRAGVGFADAERRLNEAREAVRAAQAAEQAAGQAQARATGRGLDAAAGAYAAAKARLDQAQETLRSAERTYALARQAQQQVEIRTTRGRAEAAVDPREAIRNAYEDEETRLQRIYEQETRNLHPQRDAVALAQAQGRLQSGLEAALRRREAAEKRLTDQARETNNAYGEGVQVFRSRAQALQMAGRELQGQGLNVDENPLFGGITPGAHRSSHQNAIDVNIPGAGNEAADAGSRARFDAIARSYQNRGYRVLWNGRIYEPGGDGPGPLIPRRTGTPSEQHTNHMHIEAPASIVGKPTNQGETSQMFQQERQARQDALNSYVEDIEYQQSVAQDDYARQLELQDQKIAALRAFYGDESREVIRAQRERLAIERRGQQQLLQQQRQAIQQTLQLAEQAEDARNQMEDIDRGQRGDNVDFNAQNGLIGEREALMEKARLLDEEYADNVSHEQRLFELRSQAVRDQLALANLPVEQRQQLLAQLEQMEAEHNQRMAVMNRQYARDVNTTANQMAAMQSAKWREVAATLTQSMGSAFQGLWTRSITFRDAMVQMADQLVYKFFDMGMKMLENWIVQQFTKKAVTTATTAQETAAVVAGQAAQTSAVVGGQVAQTGAKVGAAATEGGIIAATTGAKVASEAIKTGAAVAGAATSTAATAAAGTTEVATNAAVAAAGAYKSTVVIPFIGPVAAPAAAALALAAVLGFGALISARGGQERVPYDGQITELHKDEMVLPAWVANPLRSSLAAGTGLTPKNTSGSILKASSETTTTRGTDFGDAGKPDPRLPPVHFHAPGSMTQSEMERHAGTLVKVLKNAIRNREFNGMGNA